VGSHKVQESVSELFVVSTISLSLGNAQRLQVKIQKLSARSIEFDLVGVDASIANALRRILIAEVRVVNFHVLQTRRVVDIARRSQQLR
jgi:hypothetical protein